MHKVSRFGLQENRNEEYIDERVRRIHVLEKQI